MAPYVEEVKQLEQNFDILRMEHTPRGSNTVADELSKIASSRGCIPPEVIVEWLLKLFVKIPREKVSKEPWAEPSTKPIVCKAMVTELCSPGDKDTGI